jgi:hypothetical protein
MGETVTLLTPDGHRTGKTAELPVQRHDFGAGVVTFVYAWSLKRPSTSRVVHLVPVTEEPGGGLTARWWRPLCGGARPGRVREGIGDSEHACSGCLFVADGSLDQERAGDAAERERRDRQVASREQRYAELLNLGQVRGHVLHRRDGLAEVAINVPVPLLVSLIRDVPGRRYDQGTRTWLVPEAWCDDLVASLRNAGVDMRETTPA